MVLPIPMTHLIHTVDYYEKIDGRYEGSFAAPVIIEHVLLNYSYSMKKSGEGKEKVLKGILFIDCVNSHPVVEMKAGSKVVFDGKELFIKDIKPVYALELHHYEVELI